MPINACIPKSYWSEAEHFAGLLAYHTHPRRAGNVLLVHDIIQYTEEKKPLPQQLRTTRSKLDLGDRKGTAQMHHV